MNEVVNQLHRLAQLTKELDEQAERLNQLAFEALNQGKQLGEGEVYEQSLLVDKIANELTELHNQIQIMP